MAISYSVGLLQAAVSGFSVCFVSLLLLPILSHVSASSIYAIQPTTSEEVIVDGGIEVLESKEATISLIGKSLTEGQKVTFTAVDGERGSECTLGTYLEEFNVSSIETLDADADIVVATVTIKLENLPDGSEWYYFCLGTSGDSSPTIEIGGVTNSTNETSTSTTASSRLTLVHQGSRIKVKAKSRLLPLWLQIIIIGLCLMLSGLFSGLNLGLMSLDPTELIMVQNSGSDQERKYAKSISPVRKRGNFLLCSLLLGNVLVNSSLTILLDDIGGGIIAVVVSTICIVIFGEIVPQAICSRHGLAVGAKTIWLTKIFMVITFPLAFPLSILLDKILGEELGQVYSREKLAELIKLGADKKDIKHEELNIIEGALQLTKKTAADVMTQIDDVYMVDYTAILDFETMTDILHTGYTRVPVFEKERLNVVALLNVKDLAFVDPDDKIPLRTVCKFYNHPITFVFEDTRLNQLLEEFRKGQSHLAFVQRVVTEGQKDPYYDIIGIVTLEDIIEEIIQCEILDETDIITDNQTKKRRLNLRRKDFSIFNTPTEQGKLSCVSPQLTLACFQYLQTTVDPFKEEFISSNMLKRLLKQDIYINHKYDEKSIDNLLFIANKPADYFVIILQGKCTVEIGNDHLKFEAGPFFTFGAEALIYGVTTKDLIRASIPMDQAQTSAGNRNDLTSSSAQNLTDVVYAKNYSYVPDYTVRATTDLEYLKIRRHHYLAARRATLMERQPVTPNSPEDGVYTQQEDPFSIEWKRATQLSQQHREEGTPLPPYLRLHHRNYSSGNLDELRDRPDRKLSPLVSSGGAVSGVSDQQPVRTIIYPESQSTSKTTRNSKSSPLEQTERVHLLAPDPQSESTMSDNGK